MVSVRVCLCAYSAIAMIALIVALSLSQPIMVKHDVLILRAKSHSS